MVAILSGTATLLGSLLPFAAIPPFIYLIATRVIPLEERDLDRAFGEEYQRYQAAVPRWL